MEDIKVLKRDGSYEKFCEYKIKDAIQKAFESENKRLDKRVYNKVLKKIHKNRIYDVEHIQDTIEKMLHKSSNYKVLKSFMQYRFLHKMQREHILGLNKDTTFVNSTQSVEEYTKKRIGE